MISKELLSEVLYVNATKINVSVTSVSYFVEEDFLEDSWYGINIHELAHKVKEWATKQRGYYNDHIDGALYIKSDTKHSIYNHAEIWVTSLGAHRLFKNADNKGNEFCSDTEYEAIFLAGQWILENKDA